MAYDGDYTDLGGWYDSYIDSNHQTSTGHTDYYGDEDGTIIHLSSSGYYNLSSTGNTYAYVYDNSGAVRNWVYGSSYQSNLYLNKSSNDRYQLHVYGYTAGENYSVSLTPSSYSVKTDGDATDLTVSQYIYPSYSGNQTLTGHTDSYGDDDYCTISLSSSGYYNISSTGNTAACVYNGSTGKWVYGTNYQNDLYLTAGQANYLFVYGYTSGESYSVTITPSSYSNSSADGNSSDLTTSDAIYPSYSGYQTAYGHTDSYGDYDYGSIGLSSSGYYNISSTGNTSAYVYDGTTGSWVSGSSYQNNLYLYGSHVNYIFVYGYTSGESYSVTVTPANSNNYDGNSSDLTTSDYIYPGYSGYQTAYGHTDSYGDVDYGNLALSSSGYYNLTSTGNTYAFAYDGTTGSLVYGSSYQSSLYLNASHANYIFIYGYSSGENYSVTVTSV